MVKVNYDLKGSILGYYPDSIDYAVIPEPYIEIDGQTYQDCIRNSGFRKVDVVNKVIVVHAPPVPTAGEIKEQQLDELDNEYNTQFDALTLAWATAYMLGDVDTANARKVDKEVLTLEYNTKKGAIDND